MGKAIEIKKGDTVVILAGKDRARGARSFVSCQRQAR